MANESRFANRHNPVPSHQTIFTRSARLDLKTNSAPLNGSAPPSRTSAASPSGPLRPDPPPQTRARVENLESSVSRHMFRLQSILPIKDDRSSSTSRFRATRDVVDAYRRATRRHRPGLWPHLRPRTCRGRATHRGKRRGRYALEGAGLTSFCNCILELRDLLRREGLIMAVQDRADVYSRITRTATTCARAQRSAHTSEVGCRGKPSGERSGYDQIASRIGLPVLIVQRIGDICVER